MYPPHGKASSNEGPDPQDACRLIMREVPTGIDPHDGVMVFEFSSGSRHAQRSSYTIEAFLIASGRHAGLNSKGGTFSRVMWMSGLSGHGIDFSAGPSEPSTRRGSRRR
jgi:hypothetical protein